LSSDALIFYFEQRLLSLILLSNEKQTIHTSLAKLLPTKGFLKVAWAGEQTWDPFIFYFCLFSHYSTYC
jgi:hypothetical protein